MLLIGERLCHRRIDTQNWIGRNYSVRYHALFQAERDDFPGSKAVIKQPQGASHPLSLQWFWDAIDDSMGI
ncbi:MAG: hypothetical protein L3J57_14550 [Desulfuromusa sp.]|nr:hypothetical protein [Desulfuromusa sp.]